MRISVRCLASDLRCRCCYYRSLSAAAACRLWNWRSQRKMVVFEEHLHSSFGRNELDVMVTKSFEDEGWGELRGRKLRQSKANPWLVQYLWTKNLLYLPPFDRNYIGKLRLPKLDSSFGGGELSEGWKRSQSKYGPDGIPIRLLCTPLWPSCIV